MSNRQSIQVLFAVLVGIAAVTLAAAPAKEEPKAPTTQPKASLEGLPEAVKATILKEAGKNEIAEIEATQTSKGEKAYEAEWVVGGKEYSVIVAADGKVLARNVEMPLDLAPEVVRKAIQKEAGTNKVGEVAESTQDGKTTYVTGWQADGKSIQVRLSAEGKLLGKQTQTDLDSLPAPVKESILKEAGKGKIVRTFEIVKGDEKTYVALWIEDGKKLVQARLAADGKLLDKKPAGMVNAPATQPAPATGPAPAKG